jgi:3-deoxy-7-phosphoheptulonate synthase
MTSKAKSKKTSISWSHSSWRQFPIKQQPNYPDMTLLKKVEDELHKSAPLVYASEIESLKSSLAKVAQGNAFLLQAGDCAESFAEFNELNLKSFFRVLLQMTVALMYGTGTPVVKVGRIAGQFSKPRSADTEIQDGKELPCYRGDMVNSIEFDETGRIPDPERLLKVYSQSASTLNFLRSLAKGGYASLKNVNKWNQEFANNSAQGRLFSDLVGRINESLGFINSLGIDINALSEIHEAEFYTSHEGLLLNYEEALTHRDADSGKSYCCSAHMLWIGDRTRDLDSAHVEFMRGIANPIGIKVGPSMEPDTLIKLIDILNPQDEPGRLTLISRMGDDKVELHLPALLRKVKSEGRQVIWSCDPMHGNTVKSPNGYKTRPFNRILSEVKSVFDIHKAEGTHAGGIHLEMTGQDVTECVGGAQAISEVNLKDRYHTHCDPRLNASQSVELSFLLASELRKNI